MDKWSVASKKEIQRMKGLERSLELEIEECEDRYQDLGRVFGEDLDLREEWIKEAISYFEFYKVDSLIVRKLIKKGEKYLKKGLK